jgi:hypothetical protein
MEKFLTVKKIFGIVFQYARDTRTTWHIFHEAKLKW